MMPRSAGGALGTSTSVDPVLSVIVIGRNEEKRLARCLESIIAMRSAGRTEIIYVDSSSTDDSVKIATAARVKVIETSPSRPTAAAGRNAGWRAARAPLILFLDGDTVLDPNFVVDALNDFAEPQVAIVYGNLREIRPDASIFNRVLDLDWIPLPITASNHCGGDALVRRSVLEQVDGFDEELVAGEEPDMCRRMRGLGYRIVHVNRPMAGHDLAMTSFWQYWRRAVRSGYAYAEIAQRYRGTFLPFWQRETKRNLLRGSLLLAIIVAGLLIAFATRSILPLGAVLLIIGSLVARTAFRSRWKSDDFATLLCYGLHSQLQHIPIFLGQLRFWYDWRAGRRSSSIDYKDNPSRAGG